MKYLSKKRTYKHSSGLKLVIGNGVFHPALFFTTKILNKYINSIDVNGKNILELGAGSGLIAFSAAKKGAVITATDINLTAIEYLEKNSSTNNIPCTIIYSDLFDNIPFQQFDIIIINPPFYKKKPKNEAEHAWYCGENGEYFTKLFTDLGSFTNNSSKVLMILNDECDIKMIKRIALTYKFELRVIQETNLFFEQLFIFAIIPMK